MGKLYRRIAFNMEQGFADLHRELIKEIRVMNSKLERIQRTNDMLMQMIVLQGFGRHPAEVVKAQAAGTMPAMPPMGLPALPTDFMKRTQPDKEEPAEVVAHAVDKLHDEAQTVFTYSVRELSHQEGYGKCYGRNGAPMHFGLFRKDKAGAEVLLKRAANKENLIAEGRRLANRNIDKQKQHQLLQR